MIEQEEDGLQKDELTTAYLAGCHATRKAYEQRLAEAEEKLPRWIPVSERLPKECHAVLICKDGNETSYGYRLSGDWYEENVRLAAYDITVTHWMPLPEPPNNGENAG